MNKLTGWAYNEKELFIGSKVLLDHKERELFIGSKVLLDHKERSK